MAEPSRTLTEMTMDERTNMVAVVVDALEAFAEEAEESGDRQFSLNSRAVACTIRGCAGDLSRDDLATAELLMEQAVLLMHAYKSRNPYGDTIQ
ncbi:hypothetical protein WGT02_28575 (plasmid) [Rhizobium sp. T1470]|uniref:hypothetical protein n=1 Tax=unclassified Rhizobium TaxID=2613769 RepID=UPI001AAFBFAF|nr:hypothetical protein [Rhizobium sp. T1473]MCA0805132.1 hypothetical protein [Rhizobium sp. T1473]